MSTENQNITGLSKIFRNERRHLLGFIRNNLDYKYAEPEDIVQDVALKLFNSVNFDRPVENMLAFVYRAFRNRIIDIHRTKAGKQEQITIDDNEHLQNSFAENREIDNDDENDAEYKEFILYQCLEKLKPEYKEVIVATEFDNTSYKELSKKWKIPVGTLLSKKHRAMAKLQKEFFKVYNH
jgi:RNA polymerase sigma factor (sigma-70 family)